MLPLRLDGLAAMLKSCTVKVAVVVWESEPLVAVIVSW